MLFVLVLKLTLQNLKYTLPFFFLCLGHVCLHVEVHIHMIILMKKIIIESTEELQEKLRKVTDAFSSTDKHS